MGKRYRYKDKIVGVCPGLGNVWIVGWRSKSGLGSHRLKVRALPVCETAEEAQIRLDGWAKAQKLETVEESNDG